MKVLHLVTSLNPGGIERWVLSMLETIHRSDCQMDLCCQGFERGRWAYKAEALGAKVFLNTLTPDHFVFGMRLAKILRRGGYDILHIHVGVYSGFAVWIGHEMNVKVITTFHCVDFPAERWFLKLPVVESVRSVYAKWSIKYAVKESDFLVGVSQGTLDEFVPERSKFVSKAFVIPHGVNISTPKPEQSRYLFLSKLGYDEDSRVIIHVGRFSAQKNHRGVLNIFKKVSENVADARLILVGDGYLRYEIERMAHELSLGDKIAFLGFRNDVDEILAHCDLMLMPSLFEGFGIVTIEAAAAGLPVVGSRVAGLVEAVEDGQTGLLFEVHDHDGMADAIVRLLLDSGFAKKMGEAGKQRVRDHLSIEKMAAQYLQLYEQCLKQ
ncbi:MAG: glycosyltransferase [Desulfomonilaceae bacterium]|jgi:N-acetyl-alpha-D-glucosaminyl L-malate synthase BshA